MKRLGARFYARDAATVARALLGKVLVHRSSEGLCSGRIVETEAYLSEGDPASHSHRGPTRRNASMFARGGTAYVYRIYGMHLCFNVVTGRKDVGEAVLVRALEPLRGVELQSERRGVDVARRIADGPAKLVVALGIRAAHDGTSLLDGPLSIHDDGFDVALVDVTPRIGITKAADLPLRFLLRGSPHASHRRTPTPGPSNLPEPPRSKLRGK